MMGRRLSRHEQRQLDDIEHHLRGELGDLAEAFTPVPDPVDPGVRATLLGFGAMVTGIGLLVDSPLLAFIAMAASTVAAAVPSMRKPPREPGRPDRPDPLTPAT